MLRGIDAIRWGYLMRRLPFIAALVWILFPLSVVAQSEVVLFGQGDARTMYQWAVPQSRFVALPRWSPSAGTPPLPIGKAAEIADVWIKKKNSEIKSFSISSIAIAVGHGWGAEPQDRWYYRIDFQPIVGGQRLYGGQFIAVVLFDGTIVEPRAETRV
ncbi:MAG: hypothetical protein IPJ21_04275 [Sterolibacteriaceae bacterium]|nr:hypothetical protein [Sterolibacteriaceae bacterium]MBK9086874.1 hypothetical protein [Sterolibacteriaceae bacterium]